MTRILKYAYFDLLRSRFILGYTLLLAGCTIALFQLDSDPGKVVLSLLNVVLLTVPLVSVVFTSIHFFNSYEFMELMLAQPINRKVIFFGEYLAVASSLCSAVVVGVGAPLFFYGVQNWMLIFAGIALTLAFTSIAFLASVLTRDKARAIGMALFCWLYFTLIYDGLILWVIYAFNDYPLEKATLVMIALNPVDLARILMLLQLDISALMGYTGAFYQAFFGTAAGSIFSFGTLILWALLPLWMAMHIFEKRDW